MSQWFSIIWQARAKSNRYFDARGQTSGVISNRADAACSPELSGMARASRQPDRKATRTGCLSTGWTGGTPYRAGLRGWAMGGFRDAASGGSRGDGRVSGLNIRRLTHSNHSVWQAVPQLFFCAVARHHSFLFVRWFGTAAFILCGIFLPHKRILW